MLKALLASNPGLEVTPQILLGFIAEKTKHSPPRSPQSDQEVELPGRGRTEDRDAHDEHARSSSNDSNGTSVHRTPGSRPSSRGPPQTPTSAQGSSPFDTSRRQRSTPLGNNAPSSWTKRPAPAHRRKSDAGSRSDSEVCLRLVMERLCYLIDLPAVSLLQPKLLRTHPRSYPCAFKSNISLQHASQPKLIVLSFRLAPIFWLSLSTPFPGTVPTPIAVQQQQWIPLRLFW